MEHLPRGSGSRLCARSLRPWTGIGGHSPPSPAPSRWAQPLLAAGSAGARGWSTRWGLPDPAHGGESRGLGLVPILRRLLPYVLRTRSLHFKGGKPGKAC